MPSRSPERRRSPLRGPGLAIGTVIVGSMLLLGAVRAGAARRQLTLARTDLATARGAVVRRDDASAEQALAQAQRRLRSGRRAARGLPLGPLGPVPLLGSATRAATGAADAGLEAVAAGRVVLAAARTFPTSGRGGGLDGADLSGFHAAASRSAAALGTAVTHIGAADRALAGPAGAMLPFISRPARAMRREVLRTRAQLENGDRAMALLADLTGPTTDVRILLLSQDSLELRPTGGYVGSYGLLHLAHGTAKLDRFEATEDLPPPDPPMEPPPELAPVLPRSWGVSNANWWPDFPTSAGVARELYRRQGGGEVDGVLALTEYASARLVGAVGPLQLPSYREPVVEKGFDQRALYEVELKQPPDQPRKKFLQELADALFDRVFHLPSDRLPALAAALDRSAAAGDVQLWLADPARQRLLDGAVIAGRLPRTAGDFLMLVDANVSAGKANMGLTKQATYRVRRDRSGRLRARMEVTVVDDAPASPINPYYRGFLRLYVPPGARLLGRRAGQGDDGPARDGPYRVFTQILDVRPAGGRQTAVFEYLLPARVAPGGRYTLTWSRQAGTPRDTLTAVVARRTVQGDDTRRAIRLTASLRGNRLVGWLRERWVVRRLRL